MTWDEFIAQHSITMDAREANSNPNMADGEWTKSAFHWVCKLRNAAGKSLSIFFSQGSAHTTPPTAQDVLDCLMQDAATIDAAGTFERWCADLAMDTDSRKAERTYRVCCRQTEAIKRFLGDAYEAALNVERR